MKTLALWPLLALHAAVAAQPCGEGLPMRAADRDVGVAFRSDPPRIVVGSHFKLDLQLCAAAGEALPAAVRVDADMPAHRHGMNYRPSVTALGGGRWRAEGLMFHMPGRWRFIFDVTTAQGPLRLTHEVEVP